MPRTVAALYLPTVRNAPLPSPHSLRDFGFFAAALPRFPHGASGSFNVKFVIPRFWSTRNMPS